MRFAWVLFLSCLLRAEPPAAQELAATVIQNELRQFRQLGEYTFEFEHRLRVYSPKGKLERETRETGETYMSHRRNIDITLTRNGKPLRRRALNQERNEAATRMEADARFRQSNPAPAGQAGDRRGAGTSVNDTHMSAIDVLRYCALTGPRHNGALLELDFDNCQSPWREERHYPHMRGIIRIDPNALVIESWQAYVKGGPRSGTLFFSATTQPAPGGIRVPATGELNRSAAPHLYKEGIADMWFRWSNPQRFEVGVAQTVAPPKL